MSRYIDADKIIKNLDSIKELSELEGKFNEWQYARYIIKSSETEEVKPIVYGEWEHIVKGFMEFGEIRCSKCGWKNDFIKKFNFCPNCGTTMKKKSENEE